MAAKIAYVGLAHHFGQTFAMRDIFHNVRRYATTGKGAPASRLFANDSFLATVEHGPHQHSIVIAGRRDKHRVDAIVRLFGSLCYFVTLTEHYEGADIYHTLAYDAYRGEVEGMLIAHPQAEFLWVPAKKPSGMIFLLARIAS